MRQVIDAKMVCLEKNVSETDLLVHYLSPKRVKAPSPAVAPELQDGTGRVQGHRNQAGITRRGA